MISSGIRQYRWKLCLIPVILAFEASALTAQETNSQPTPPSSSVQSSGEPNPLDVGRFFRDEYRIWTSPFRPRNYKSPTMKKYGVPFLLISGGLIASDRKTVGLFAHTPDQLAWSGRVSQVGASYSLVGISGATYLLGKGIGNKHMSKTGLMGLEALAHAEMVTFGLKLMTGRERPSDNDRQGRFWKGRDSFPSGHAATSFALATVFAYEYRDHVFVPIAAYSAAALITASRTSARRHWPSDVFVGASIGFLLGRYVYKNHHDPALPGGPPAKTSRLIPSFAFGAGAATVHWSF